MTKMHKVRLRTMFVISVTTRHCWCEHRTALAVSEIQDSHFRFQDFNGTRRHEDTKSL